MDLSQIKQRIADLYTTPCADGAILGIKEISNILGVHQSTVAYHLKRMDIPRRKKGPHKITPAMKIEIVRQYTTQLPDGTWKGSEMIARDLGISGSAVQLILHEMNVPIRSASESHAHGKRCGPIKYTEQLGAPALCACGCGTPTKWERTHRRWAIFVPGHRYKDAPYKDESWLREQYLERRRNAPEIAAECNVNVTTIIRYMERYGIERRTTKESLKGVQAGAKNPAWKGGVTPERQRLYKQGGWREFTKQIFARDGYVCQRCKQGISGNKKRSGAAHHIKSWAGHPELRFDPTNVITLCRKCHLWVHSRANVAREFLG